MKITPDLLEAHLKCPTKGWLCAVAEPPTGNEYADWVKTQSESYRVTATERLLAQTPPAEVAVFPPADTLKTAKWRLAMRLVAGASTLPRSSRREEAHTEVRSEQPEGRPDQSLVTSAATSLASRLHAIERIASEGRGKAAQFIPIRFIYRNKLTKDDKLVLAFDALVLAQTLGRDIAVGKIIQSDAHATLKPKVPQQGHLYCHAASIQA